MWVQKGGDRGNAPQWARRAETGHRRCRDRTRGIGPETDAPTTARIVNTAPLSAELQSDPALLCGCVAGAAPADRVENWLAAAGFADVRVTPRPDSRELIKTWAPGRNLENHIVSAIVEARKP